MVKWNRIKIFMIYVIVTYITTLTLTSVSVENQMTDIRNEKNKTIDSLQHQVDTLIAYKEEYNRVMNSVFELKYARLDGTWNFTLIYYKDNLVKASHNIDSNIFKKTIDMAIKDSIPTYFLLAFADMETRINHYNPDSTIIRSYARAWGVMQITEIAVKEINKKTNKNYDFKLIKSDPEENLKFSIDYIKCYGILSFYEQLYNEYKDTKKAYYKIYRMVHDVYNYGPYSNKAFKSGYIRNKYEINMLENIQ